MSAELEPKRDYARQVEEGKKAYEVGDIKKLRDPSNFPDIEENRLKIWQILALQNRNNEAWPARNHVRTDPAAALGICTYILHNMQEGIEIAQTLPRDQAAEFLCRIMWLSVEEMKNLDLAIQYGDPDTFDPTKNPTVATLPDKIRLRMQAAAAKNDKQRLIQEYGRRRLDEASQEKYKAFSSSNLFFNQSRQRNLVALLKPTGIKDLSG